MPTREEMRSLAESIVGAYADRVASIAELRETVREVRADLARGSANRKHEVGVMLDGFGQALATIGKETRADLAKGVADRKHEVGIMLDGLGQALATMGKEMRADTAKVRPPLEEQEKKRRSEAREFMGELSKAVAEGKAATQALLRGFAEVQAGAREEWQKLTTTMQAKRGGMAVTITPETAVLRGQVFEYLANHPDGTRMTGLEQEFGMARIQMAKLLKNLMAEKKVMKQELFYFAL